MAAPYVDVAELALYSFFGFFLALVFYLRREDRREGYPLEDDISGRVDSDNPAVVHAIGCAALVAGRLAPSAAA